MFVLYRDHGSCTQCGLCEKYFTGLPNLNRIRIKASDFKKLHIRKGIKNAISGCPTDSIFLDSDLEEII